MNVQIGLPWLITQNDRYMKNILLPFVLEWDTIILKCYYRNFIKPIKAIIKKNNIKPYNATWEQTLFN